MPGFFFSQAITGTSGYIPQKVTPGFQERLALVFPLLFYTMPGERADTPWCLKHLHITVLAETFTQNTYTGFFVWFFWEQSQ